MTSRVRALIILLLFAVLFACVLSTAVISGEHPWGSDGRHDTGSTAPPIADTTSVVASTDRAGTGFSATSSSDGRASVDWVQRLLFKAAWKYAQWYRPFRNSSMQADR
jgi:hypothetical protein